MALNGTIDGPRQYGGHVSGSDLPMSSETDVSSGLIEGCTAGRLVTSPR